MPATRYDSLALISRAFPHDPIVLTCGATCREMAAADRRENHYYIVDTMGIVTPIALGLALGLPPNPQRKVIAIEGDGGMLTNLNALTTVGYLQPPNLLLIILDNESYASTGGQPTFAARLNLADIAESCGLRAYRAQELETLQTALTQAAQTPGPALIHMKISPGNAQAPLLLDDPVTLRHRFHRWLSENAGAPA